MRTLHAAAAITIAGPLTWGHARFTPRLGVEAGGFDRPDRSGLDSPATVVANDGIA